MGGTIATVPRPPKPYAELERGRTRLRFFHGDAIQTLNALGAGSIDAIVTSPPYNLGIQYRPYDDGRPRSEYLKWTADWIQAARRALAKDGSLFLNVGAKPKDPDRPRLPRPSGLISNCRTSFTG